MINSYTSLRSSFGIPVVLVTSMLCGNMTLTNFIISSYIWAVVNKSGSYLDAGENNATWSNDFDESPHLSFGCTTVIKFSQQVQHLMKNPLGTHSQVLEMPLLQGTLLWQTFISPVIRYGHQILTIPTLIREESISTPQRCWWHNHYMFTWLWQIFLSASVITLGQ